jgi:hypothetical protein
VAWPPDQLAPTHLRSQLWSRVPHRRFFTAALLEMLVATLRFPQGSYPLAADQELATRVRAETNTTPFQKCVLATRRPHQTSAMRTVRCHQAQNSAFPLDVSARPRVASAIAWAPQLARSFPPCWRVLSLPVAWTHATMVSCLSRKAPAPRPHTPSRPQHPPTNRVAQSPWPWLHADCTCNSRGGCHPLWGCMTSMWHLLSSPIIGQVTCYVRVTHTHSLTRARSSCFHRFLQAALSTA